MEKIIYSLEDLKNLRKPIHNTYVLHKQYRSASENFAMWIAKNVGSIGFFIVILVWTIAWLLWNTIGPAQYRFDPFPAFELWLFVANVIQICLMPLILVGQNLDAKRNEIKAQEEYELAIRSERELETVITLLEKQGVALDRIEKFLGISIPNPDQA